MESLFGGGRLRTKDGLKEEAYEITREVRQLEKSYTRLYTPLRELSETYTECRSEMVFFRYKSLKDMIKTCLNDYELQKTEQRKAASSKTNTKGAGTFLEVASETNAVMSEVEPLRKAELIQDIEEKKIKKERLKGKFQLLENSIESLRTEYLTSKQQLPTSRYRLLKRTIKQLIRTENLKP